MGASSDRREKREESVPGNLMRGEEGHHTGEIRNFGKRNHRHLITPQTRESCPINLRELDEFHRWRIPLKAERVW